MIPKNHYIFIIGTRCSICKTNDRFTTLLYNFIFTVHFRLFKKLLKWKCLQYISELTLFPS